MSPDPAHSSQRALGLIANALARPQSPFGAAPPRTLVVDVERQRLILVEGSEVRGDYAVSTASAGVGSEEGSFRTPPGWHRVHARIGAGSPSGAVFESRIATGRIWRGESDPEDLILTRVLTLEGLEDSVNRGTGRDSLERYIYVHGTNHPEDLGRPASHGCIRMSNEDVADLFERVREGDALVVVGPVSSAVAALAAGHETAARGAGPLGPGRYHYAGLGGSGMSALAQFQALSGAAVSGSDRSFDRGERPEARALLEALGITVTAQDGSGLATPPTALVVSTAVEEQVPDVAAARAAQVPVIHRSEMLAHFVRTHRAIAIAGTSGKSTVVAMVFEILAGAGRSPSVITGGDLRVLQARGAWGNAWRGDSDLLVVEADESDGSLVRYEPAVGVVLNLERDHKETAEVAAMFDEFLSRTREARVIGEAQNLAVHAPGSVVFGFGPGARIRGEAVEATVQGSRFDVRGVGFTLPVPGRHNVANALAAIAACAAVGVPLEAMVEPLARFQGVDRRFQVVGRVDDIEVVDDFAHNPSKLEAAIATARARARGRVLAVYQPHGYGPTRFLRPDFVHSLSTALGPEDLLWMLEIFYAGGTARRDFSAADIIAEIAERGTRAEFAPSRPWLIDRLAGEARPGDLVIIMGARDPSLTGLARDVVAELSRRHAERGAGKSR